MSAAAIDFTYRYPFASGLSDSKQGLGLTLATCGLSHEHPHFFDGRMREPQVVGCLLLAVSEVVSTHYFLPRPPLIDPVVTSNEAVLRFEGFSGCCGVYARADLPAEAFDRDIQGRGTTNVDFNNPMRTALSRLRDGDEVRLAVGREEVALERGDEAVVEKKVSLPVRWVKGFSEVQAYQPGLVRRLEVSAAEARQLLRSLPRGCVPKRPSYVVQSGRALRVSQRESPGAIRVSGLHRLRVLAPMLLGARGLAVWSDEDTGTSAWEVRFPTGRFFLMLSPELHRGFSGEGQVLNTLAGNDWQGAPGGCWPRTVRVSRKPTVPGPGTSPFKAARWPTRCVLDPCPTRCTCPWFSRHQGERGPCKHILAARLLADGEQDSEGEKGP